MEGSASASRSRAEGGNTRQERVYACERGGVKGKRGSVWAAQRAGWRWTMAFVGGCAVRSLARPAGAEAARSSGSRVAVLASRTLNGATIERPLRAVRNNVLVKIAEAPEKTAGGLLLATEAMEKPNYGVAVSVGEGAFFPSGGKIDMSINENDVVLFGSYGGDEITYDGAKHAFITQDDVLCYFEGGEYKADAVRPVYDRVFVKKDKGVTETASGLTLSTNAVEKPTSGEVISHGPGRLMENGQYEPVQFKVGERVMFGKYSGSEVKFDGVEYVLVRVADIFAVL
ncbi:20 kDa chaperonin, chloroplastic [Porphyridium purpureum]|uniref:20 kDa chaperonin, chloroplastic n=1 Tax=Porphyridium purpureum TaxID=35688 RepID=A0A5J4YN10_PORPP|nr:20 kDa chaperonin, chloroplastic [Porphyridium purpureum]|eukprot:POR3882..scf244_11